MKYTAKIIIYIILIIIVTLIICTFFIKPNPLKFKETNEFKNIEYNKDNIKEINIRTETLIGRYCYKIDIEKGYKLLNNISIKNKTNMICTDSDMYIEVYFNNNTKNTFKFECGNLVYNQDRYKLKNKIKLYNKDEYLPNEITEDMIIISNVDKVECK